MALQRCCSWSLRGRRPTRVNITGVSLFTTLSNGQCNSIGGGGIPI